MKKSVLAIFALVTLTVLLVNACAPVPTPVPPTLTPLSTDTPLPTDAPLPTNTPIPTNTPQPTATSCITEPDSVSTLQSVQDRIIALIPDARAIWYDSFNCDVLNDGWELAHDNSTTKMTVANSAVAISAQKVENVWEIFSRTSNNLEDGKGMLVLFQYKAGTSVLLFAYTGDWQTPNYFRWGLNINNDPGNMWQGWDGTKWVSSGFPKNVLRSDTPFYLMIRLNDNGMLTTKVWEKDNPKNSVTFQRKMQSRWIGHSWASQFQLIEGVLEIDEYVEFSFGKP